MRALSATELLTVWERGMSQPPVLRALTMLAIACPESSMEELARLNIGRRDSQILELREKTFGEQFTGLTDCPACGEKIELNFSASDIRSTAKDEPAAELAFQINVGNVRFRLPTSADVLAVNTPEQLLERCLLSDGDHLGESFDAAGQKMSDADPLAEVQLALFCPCCAQQWQAPFDIVAFFWREISAAARRLLREVHTLASAYGWTEPEILALNPARRRVYLEMVGA